MTPSLRFKLSAGLGAEMQSLQVVQAVHARVPHKGWRSARRSQCSARTGYVSCALHHPDRCCTEAGHLLALAAVAAPLLVPMQAFGEDQVAIADAGTSSVQIVRWACVSPCTSGT